jgi:hypothetical protein
MPSPESAQVEPLTQEIVSRLQTLPSRTTADVRAIRREFSKRLAHASPKMMIALALRELAKRDPKAVRTFVAEHKDRAGRACAA